MISTRNMSASLRRGLRGACVPDGSFTGAIFAGVIDILVKDRGFSRIKVLPQLPIGEE